jgi:hypothetical protein
MLQLVSQAEAPPLAPTGRSRPSSRISARASCTLLEPSASSIALEPSFSIAAVATDGSGPGPSPEWALFEFNGIKERLANLEAKADALAEVQVSTPAVGSGWAGTQTKAICAHSLFKHAHQSPCTWLSEPQEADQELWEVTEQLREDLDKSTKLAATKDCMDKGFEATNNAFRCAARRRRCPNA